MQTQTNMPQANVAQSTMQSDNTLQTPGGNGHDVRPAQKGDAVQSGISREFHNVLTDIEHLIREMTSLSATDLALAKTRLVAQIATARESAGAMGGVIHERAHKTAAVTNTYVHEQPWTAIGIGAAAGMLFGALLARR
jgi:ElaB/YqjD/DUF883 family membrane-anchored ribosome-binding protein